jgi:hypothetical protein
MGFNLTKKKVKRSGIEKKGEIAKKRAPAKKAEMAKKMMA